jgi:hypothetical protein
MYDDNTNYYLCKLIIAKKAYIIDITKTKLRIVEYGQVGLVVLEKIDFLPITFNQTFMIFNDYD